jgi:DNA-binding beta-propeller fold protein YncE
MKPSLFVAALALVASSLAAEKPTLRQTIALAPALKLGKVAISPSGKQIAAATRDNKILLWDVASGTLKNTLDLNGERPAALQFASAGELLAAGGEKGTLRVWDSSGSLKREYKLPAEIDALAFAPDHSSIAVAPLERPVEVLSLADGKLLASLPASFGGSASVAFSPDGRWLATADVDTEVRIIDAHSFVVHNRFTDFALEPFALRFSSDSTQVVVGGADGIISIIDVNTAKTARTFPKQSDVIFALCTSPDGRSVAGAYFDPNQITAPGRTLVWDISSGSSRTVISETGFNGGDYLDDNTLLLTSGSEKELKVWAVR